jgi:hypothetical protein
LLLGKRKAGFPRFSRRNSEMHEVFDLFMKSISKAFAFAALQRDV